MAWSMLERLSVQVVQFIIGIILARLLTPTEYGLIGILLVIIAFMQVFIDSGFSKALIQKQDRSELDYSTVFFINGLISIVCYIFLWFGATWLADFYNNSQLINFTRLIGLVLFFNALFAVPNTILIIHLDFKALAKINFTGNLISGVIAIFLAYYGFGVWSLIWQQIIRALLLVLLSWFLIRWKPLFIFSKESFKILFAFGSKLLYASLLGVIVNNFTNLFIAKLSSTKELGYFTRGTQFTDVIYGTASSVLDSVLLPVFSNSQNDLPLLVRYFKTFIRSVALIMVPLFFLLAFVSKPLVVLLLTEKWLPVVPIVQIFCFARLITIIAGLNVTVLFAIGRSDLVLKQQVIKIIIRVVFLVFALKFGIIYIAVAELLSTIAHFFINTYYPGKIMKINAIEQIKEMLPIALAGGVMLMAVWSATYFVPNNLWLVQLVTSGIVGIISYVWMIKILKVQEYQFLLSKVAELVKRN
jgi:O-antigen/teichoic acid export membrane protein